MTQNTSHAVMAQRREAHDSLDHFPTPPWATRALCEWLNHERMIHSKSTAWDPACAEGHMVKPLREYFAYVEASDVHAYGGLQNAQGDFLIPGLEPRRIWDDGVDWIITNPPFRLAQEFIERAQGLARIGCAMLVRTSFLEGVDRCENLFTKRPPHAVLQFAERVVMHKGKLSETGSTATAYCWIVWTRHTSAWGARLCWIKPCRRALEQPGDYDEIVGGVV